MKKFANLFSYETVNFDGGRYTNCILLEDVHYPNSKSVYALAGEIFPTILVDLNTCDLYFFEEYDENIPAFTIKFKLVYI